MLASMSSAFSRVYHPENDLFVSRIFRRSRPYCFEMVDATSSCTSVGACVRSRLGPIKTVLPVVS